MHARTCPPCPCIHKSLTDIVVVHIYTTRVTEAVEAAASADVDRVEKTLLELRQKTDGAFCVFRNEDFLCAFFAQKKSTF